MKAEDVKVRACPYSDFLVAGKLESFVHLSLYRLPGDRPNKR